MVEDRVIPATGTELTKASGVPELLGLIRPAWQAKNLIERVRRLLPVDPSSACQRIFNAAVHDLREKVVVAGLDIAGEAAKQHKLPPIERPEDVEEYATAKLIDLAYRIGLLSRPEWRRLSRVYEIRRDLEHEDDEYEAGIEDCIYVFKTCVEVVLSRDPIHLLRVSDVREIVEQSGPVMPNQALLDDYQHAPQPRQEEISRFLISAALDDKKPDIVRQNAFHLIQSLEQLTQRPVKLKLATHMQERIGRNPLELLHARVAQASGTLAYIKRAHRSGFFKAFLAEMKKVGHDWRSHANHGELLRNLVEVGGLRFCPQPPRKDILEWLVLAYMGEPGGYGMGRRRKVFYSNTAEPLVEEILKACSDIIVDELKGLESGPAVKKASRDKHVARRFQELLDLVQSRVESDSPS